MIDPTCQDCLRSGPGCYQHSTDWQRQGTHYDGCATAHHACAVAEVERLRKLNRELVEVAAAVSVIASDNWSKRQIEYLRELADEKLALCRREVEA